MNSRHMKRPSTNRFVVLPPRPWVKTIAVATSLLLPAALVAKAEEKTADVAAYCAEKYGAGAEQNIDNRDRGLLCTVRANQGLSLSHYKIQASDVCSAQHGTRRFRTAADKVICITGTGTQRRADKRKIDLKQYCRDTHGPDTTVATRRTDNAPMCRVVTSGGLGQTFHVVPLSALCGRQAGPSQVKGEVLDCSGGSSQTAGPAPENDSPGGKKSPPSNGQNTEPGEETGRQGVPGTNAEQAAVAKREVNGDLDGCYYYRNPVMYELRDAEGEHAKWGGIEFPCPGLPEGGWTTTSEEYCEVLMAPWYSPGTKVETKYVGKKPYCWFPETEERSDFDLPNACRIKFQLITGTFRRNEIPNIKAATEWACSTAARWQGGVLTCFRIGDESKQSFTDLAARYECEVPETSKQPEQVVEGET